MLMAGPEPIHAASSCPPAKACAIWPPVVNRISLILVPSSLSQPLSLAAANWGITRKGKYPTVSCSGRSKVRAGAGCVAPVEAVRPSSKANRPNIGDFVTIILPSWTQWYERLPPQNGDDSAGSIPVRAILFPKTCQHVLLLTPNPIHVHGKKQHQTGQTANPVMEEQRLGDCSQPMPSVYGMPNIAVCTVGYE